MSPSTEPIWLRHAREDLGVAEIAGPKANPRIMAYYKAAGADWAKDDAVPWCGSAMAAWVAGAGHPVPPEAARARAWLDWGVPLEQPKCGAIIVFRRGSDPVSGHVALYLEDRGDRVLVLGGNQGDAVSITTYPKRDILGYRWPPGAAETTPDIVRVTVPDKPLRRSGTVWGGVGALGASAGGFADGSLSTGLEWTAALTEVAPIKAALMEAGANTRALALGLGVFAALLVIARRARAKMEGKSA